MQVVIVSKHCALHVFDVLSMEKFNGNRSQAFKEINRNGKFLVIIINRSNNAFHIHKRAFENLHRFAHIERF